MFSVQSAVRMTAVLVVVAIGTVAATALHEISGQLLRVHQASNQFDSQRKVDSLPYAHSFSINAAAGMQQTETARRMLPVLGSRGNEGWPQQDDAPFPDDGHHPQILGFDEPIPLPQDPALRRFEEDLTPTTTTAPVEIVKTSEVSDVVLCGDSGNKWCKKCWHVRSDVPKKSGACYQSYTKHQCVGDGMHWCPDLPQIQIAPGVKRAFDFENRIYTTTPKPWLMQGPLALRFIQHRVSDGSWHCYVDPDRSGQVHEMQKECADTDNSFCNGVICSSSFACRMTAVKMEGVVYRRVRGAKTITYVADPKVAIPEWVSPVLGTVTHIERVCNSLLESNQTCRGFSCFNFTSMGRYACGLLAEAIPVVDRFEKVIVPRNEEPSQLESKENMDYWDACFPADTLSHIRWLGTPHQHLPHVNKPTLDRQDVDQNLTVSEDAWRGSAPTWGGAQRAMFMAYTIQPYTNVEGNDVAINPPGSQKTNSTLAATEWVYHIGLEECVKACNADDRCTGFVTVPAVTSASGPQQFAKCVFKDKVVLTAQGERGEALYTKPLPTVDEIPKDAYENLTAQR